MEILTKKFKIKESIDVYVFNERTDSKNLKIQFYRINTREKITIETTKVSSEIVAKIDGSKTPLEIIKQLNYEISEEELKEFFQYLENEGIITENNRKITEDSPLFRYTRQINFFQDLLPSLDPIEVQNSLSEKKITIIGCGAIGSTIAILLTRAGILNFTLVDNKRLTSSSLQRHLYAFKNNIGEMKTDELEKYLKKINSKVHVEKHNVKIVPNSDLDLIIPQDCDLVINTADEPYIGHLTLKIGRYTWQKNIAMYVAGGFDAHLMSTGELISKGITPCADCCSNTFRKALKDWKPEYTEYNPDLIRKKQEFIDKISDFQVSRSGGMSSQSLFSASYSTINIINYLTKNTSSLRTSRGEYIINHGKMTWFEMEKQDDCQYCR